MSPDHEKASPLTVERQPPREPKRRRTWLNFVLQFLSLLWIAPAVTVFALNAKGYIIGASLGCGIKGCYYDPSSTSSQQLADEDRNITGALQFAAKALEIWFGVIVGALVYDVMVWLAATGDGLPLFYLKTPASLSPSILLEPSFWLSTAPHRRARDGRTWSIRLFLLLVLVVIAVATLMGPGVATLLLPILGWKTVPSVQPVFRFVRLASPDPPSTDSTSEALEGRCFSNDYETGSYKCSGSIEILDGLVEYNSITSGNLGMLLTHGSEAYSFNQSVRGAVIYAPFDQTLDHVDVDWDDWEQSTTPANPDWASADFPGLSPQDFYLMKKAQQTVRLRKGPALYTLSACYSNGTSVIDVGPEKRVRCYGIPTDDDLWSTYGAPLPTSNSSAGSATRCIREGSGWPSGSNNQSFFSIDSGNASAPVRVGVYSSDRAVLLNTSTSATCLGDISNTTGTQCDWDALFAEDPPAVFRNMSVNAQVTEYNTDRYPDTYCMTWTYLRFATYRLDTTHLTNPNNLIVLEDDGFGATLGTNLSTFTDPIAVHPDWSLLAWSVDKNGTVAVQSDAARILLSTFAEIYDPPYLTGTLALAQQVHNLVAAQGQFYIAYTTTNDSSVALDPIRNPTLDINISVYLWYYGLASSTAKLGAVIILLGCVLVLAKVVVGLLIPADHRSFLNLLVGALMQAPPRPIVDMAERPESEIAKKRFRMEDGEWPEFRFKE